MKTGLIDVGLVYFRTTTLDHLDAALFTLARQNFSRVRRLLIIDNNTDDSERSILDCINRYKFPVGVVLQCFKHGDPSKTHSWSVNRFIEIANTEWIFFTRSDYLLSYNCLSKFLEEADSRLEEPAWRGLITSNCHQMGYDAQLSNTDALAPYSYSCASWRFHLSGPDYLFGKVPAHYFESSGVDAGVWLTQRQNYISIGGMNEKMVNWGFNQQEAQGIMQSQGVKMIALKEYLYHHQHHYAPRDFTIAGREMEQFAR